MSFFGTPQIIHRTKKGAGFQTYGGVLSPDGTTLLFWERDGVGLLNRKTGQEQRLSAKSKEHNRPGFSPDGKTVAFRGEREKMYLAVLGKEPKLIATPRINAQQCLFSPDGLLLAAFSDRRVSTWEVATQKKLSDIDLPEDALEEDRPFMSVSLRNDGALAAIMYAKNLIRIWNARTGLVQRDLMTEGQEVYDLKFCPDGSLISISTGGIIERWNTESGKVRQKIVATEDGYDYELSVSPNGALLALSKGTGVELWDLKKGACADMTGTRENGGWLSSLSWSADSKTLALRSNDDDFYLWPTVEARPVAEAKSTQERLMQALKALDGIRYGWKVAAVPRKEFQGSLTSKEGRLWYVQEDLQKAFNKAGELIKPLTMKWAASSYSGDHCRFQVVFAGEGLSPAFAPDGTLVLHPETAQRETVLVRLVSAMAALRAMGFVTLPSSTETTSGCWEDVAEKKKELSRGAIFWNHQAHRGAFDLSGNLVRSLPMGWEGPREKLVFVLKKFGLNAVTPPDEKTTIMIEP